MTQAGELPPEEEYARRLLGATREEAARADQKASVLVAGLGVMAAILATGILDGKWTPIDLGGFDQFLWWVGCLGILTGMVSAGAAIYPRTSNDRRRHRVTYFGHVCDYESPDDLRGPIAESARDQHGATLDQLYVLSKIVDRKYTCVRWTLWLTGAAVGLFVVLGLRQFY